MTAWRQRSPLFREPAPCPRGIAARARDHRQSGYGMQEERHTRRVNVFAEPARQTARGGPQLSEPAQKFQPGPFSPAPTDRGLPMATLRKITVAASLAALTFASAVVSTSPAYAWCNGYYCGYHGGWGHHYGWAPGLAVGLAAGALAAGAVYSAETSCVSYRDIYDRWGNYVGRQAVRVC